MADLIIPKVWEGKEICICVTEERAVFVYDKEQDKFIDTGETAMELPPHGRLIDERKVTARIISKDRAYYTKEQFERVVVEAICDAPTVLEASE